MAGGRPDRGASFSPSIPSCRNRCSQRNTVCRAIPSCFAISCLALPAANSAMIIARSTSLTADVRLPARDFSYACDCSSSWMFSARGIVETCAAWGFLAAVKVKGQYGFGGAEQAQEIRPVVRLSTADAWFRFLSAFKRTGSQQLTETAMHRQRQHFLDRTRRFMRKVILAAAGRASQQDPVGRAIAGPAEPLRIDEGFQQIHRMRIEPLPRPEPASPCVLARLSHL
jgi:hypothetical protein